MRWNLLPIPDPGSAANLAIRLNSLGSLYFFEKFILQRDRMGELHRYICSTLENDYLRYLLEMPRDHLKTTIVTEGRTIWRSLPFNEEDEAAMRTLGYGDEFIAWMKRIHMPGRRTLIVSENLDNSIKLGLRFDWHYTTNDRFKATFPEIIPTKSEAWTQETKTHSTDAKGPNGEGTYDFLSVGKALQSRHYTDVLEDDVVGRDAIKSDIVMADTINYHKLMVGAFERFKTGSWTVVNNRWAPNDLSGWIRVNDKNNVWVKESHSALGGCCDMHPPGIPIYPEEFSIETLDELRETLGPYYFSHQYLNLPVSEEDIVFKKEWLRFYHPTPAPSTSGSRSGKHWLRHEVLEGDVEKDIDPSLLMRTMTVDPNHRGAQGRARHAIIVTGLDPETDRVYLLDLWAASKSYEEFTLNIYRMAKLWGLAEIWLETVAAQTILKYHLEYRNRIEGRSLKINPLKTDHSANGKRSRIEALLPLFQEGRFFCRHDQNEFLTEYYAYPGGYTVDVLDALGYAPQTWNAVHAKSVLKLIEERRRKLGFRGRSRVTGY